MTDKELLEAAAKAAGRIDWDHAPYIKSDEGDSKPWWNPLQDDGDALRLAVKLFLQEAFQLAHREVSDAVDIYAATRRAIVRAAAEIGKHS